MNLYRPEVPSLIRKRNHSDMMQVCQNCQITQRIEYSAANFQVSGSNLTDINKLLIHSLTPGISDRACYIEMMMMIDGLQSLLCTWQAKSAELLQR